MVTESRASSAPNPLAPLLARMLRDSRLWRELLSIALDQARERDQDYQKLNARYIALLEQYRALQRANPDPQRLRAAKGTRKAA